ncbi:hypothetical protein KJ870_05345 [bacterium]|nr:hypothetical protein [bacterium]MBU1434343.1 hypothetical protein [bacterium]MBU1503734.1 hypothetical protein [bacterium]
MPLENIKSLSKTLQLDFQAREDGIYQLWHRNSYSFIEFKHLYTYLKSYYEENSLDDINKNEYCLSIKFRFHSWHASGDRTDLNDITSVMIGLYLRFLLKTSFKFIDIEHPILDGELELYGREIIPSQPIDCIIDFQNNNQVDSFKKLILNFTLLNDMLFNIFECSNNIEDRCIYSDEKLDKWASLITQTIKSDNLPIYNLRTNPKWLYYKDENISIVKSKYLVDSLFHIYSNNKIEPIEGINGKLFIDDNMKNIIYHKPYNLAKKVLKALEENTSSFMLIPLENISILAGKENLIFFKNDGGFDNFIKEKELIRQRHFQETKILFKDNNISLEIHTKQDSNLFEDLIVELLKRENHIFWAKKVAPTNQPDNGRDIICKFNSKYKNNTFEKDTQNIDYEKLIVQCKTNLINSKKQSIGKSDVDVADTIFDYKPHGYMIVTNTQITTRLTEYLETIEQREGIYIDWWNKEDIEERLLKYPELIHKFSDIIKSEF